MRELVAKRYAKALVDVIGESGLYGAIDWLKRVEMAFEVESFADLLGSPQVDKGVKCKLTLEVLGDGEPRLVNFIRALADKNRLELIPYICKELERLMAVSRNEYMAILIAEEEFDIATLESIRQTLAKKLNANLVISQKKSQLEGIKLIVDDLGVEISFSRERFVSDLSKHILKAF